MGTRHVVAGVAVGAFGLLLGGCGWMEESFTDNEAIGQDIRSVRFDNDAGDVKIRTGGETTVKREVHYDGDEPGDTYRVDGDVLVIEDCTSRNCWVNYEITVPEGTTVNGRVDSGEIEVSGLAEANVQTESGEVTVRDVAGAVNVTTQSGSIDLSGIGDTVVARAESGEVTVGLAKAADVTAQTASGGITVTVPPGSYEVRADSNDGATVDDRLTSGANADHTIDVHADSGEVEVKQS